MHFSRSSSPHIGSSFQWVSWVDLHWHQRNLKLHYCCIGGTLWRVWWGWGSLVYFWFLWEVAQLLCLETCPWASRLLRFLRLAPETYISTALQPRGTCRRLWEHRQVTHSPEPKAILKNFRSVMNSNATPGPQKGLCYSTGQGKQGKETERHFHI